MKSDAKRSYRHGFSRTNDNREGDDEYTSSEETHDCGLKSLEDKI